MYPGRGVLHTPHQTFPQGDEICKRRPNVRLFVPYGTIRWGVCNTPLPCDLKTRRVLDFLPSSNTETRRVLHFLPTRNTKPRHVLHSLPSSNTETRRVLHFLPSREFERRCVLPLLFFFSCLDARKEAKENQGIRDASQFLGLSDGLNVPGKLPRPRQRAFSCLDARKEAKENQGVRDASQVCRVHDRWSRNLSRVCLLFFDCCF